MPYRLLLSYRTQRDCAWDAFFSIAKAFREGWWSIKVSLQPWRRELYHRTTYEANTSGSRWDHGLAASNCEARRKRVASSPKRPMK